tara:strand:+ start:395 stop:604 length:210 start_codon:yes stop_codon:yes gene_type:complete
LIISFTNKKQVYQKILPDIIEKHTPIIVSGGSTIKEIFNLLDKKLDNIFLLSDERMVKNTSKLRNDFFF